MLSFRSEVSVLDGQQFWIVCYISGMFSNGTTLRELILPCKASYSSTSSPLPQLLFPSDGCKVPAQQRTQTQAKEDVHG